MGFLGFHDLESTSLDEKDLAGKMFGSSTASKVGLAVRIILNSLNLDRDGMDDRRCWDGERGATCKTRLRRLFTLTLCLLSDRAFCFLLHLIV